MKIASRLSLLEPEAAFTVLEKAQQLEKKGRKIIHFEIGQPDFPTPLSITQKAITALRNGYTRYTPSLGIPELRAEIAKKTAQKTGVETTPHEVAVTPGCKNSLFIALAATIETGDEVIYPDPGFPAYRSLIRFFGGKPIPIPLQENKGFSFDMNRLKKSISKKTKAILLNYPSNPTGTMIPKNDLRKIADLVSGTGIWLLTDEIYREITYSDEPYQSIYGFPGMKNRTIVINGFSKTYSMTGWRIGFLIFPRRLTEKIDLLLNNSVSCTAAFTQIAALQALQGSQTSIDKMVTEYKKRRDFVHKALNEIPGMKCTLPTGAFYAFPNIQSYKKTSKDLASYLLENANVALLDGTAFGRYGEGYLRISYATNMENLQRGIERLRVALERLT